MNKIFNSIIVFFVLLPFCVKAERIIPNYIDPRDDSQGATYDYAFEVLASTKVEFQPRVKFGAPVFMIGNFTDATLSLDMCARDLPRLPREIGPNSAAKGLFYYNTVAFRGEYDYARYYTIRDGSATPAKLAIHLRNYRQIKLSPHGDSANERTARILEILGLQTAFIPFVGEYISLVLHFAAFFLSHPGAEPDPNDLTYRLNGYIFPMSKNIGGSPMCFYVLDKKGRQSYDTFYFTTDDALNEPSNKYLVQCSVIRSFEQGTNSKVYTQPYFTINLYDKKKFLQALNVSYAKDIREAGLDNKDENLKKLVDLYCNTDINTLISRADKAGGANTQFVADIFYNAFSADRVPRAEDTDNFKKAYNLMTAK